MKNYFLLSLLCCFLTACGSPHVNQDHALSVTARLTPPYVGKKVMDATVLITDPRFGMRIDPVSDASHGNLIVTLFDVGGGQLPVSAQISLLKAHCVAYTYDGTFPKLYVDGVLVTPQGGGPIHFSTSGALLIDSPSIVSDVQVSEGVLSAADVAKKCQ